MIIINSNIKYFTQDNKLKFLVREMFNFNGWIIPRFLCAFPQIKFLIHTTTKYHFIEQLLQYIHITIHND